MSSVVRIGVEPGRHAIWFRADGFVDHRASGRFISEQIYCGMNPVQRLRIAIGLTQKELAAVAGTSQSAIAAYESGRKSPTWRTVERLAHSAGCEVDVRFMSPLTREDRRSLALHAAIASRLRAEPEVVRARAHRSLARMRALHPGARPSLDEWRCLLRRPLESLILVLTDPVSWARELRHVTPFSGVLSAAERARVYREFAERELAASTSEFATMGRAS